MSHKRGALSIEDMQFINEHIEDMEPALIAAHLNRNPAPIIRYIQRHKVGKTFEEIKSEAERTETTIYRDLRTKSFYRNLKQQLTASELEYFQDHWVALVLQFNGDLAASEEMELKELLILEILKNREASNQYNRMVQLEQINKELKRELSLPPGERDKELIQDLRREQTDLTVTSNTYVRNFKDLCDRAEKMRKALHASRQDRVKTFEDAKVDFVAFLRALEEHGEKIKVGKEMEIIKRAQQKERERLTGFHSFSDGKVDRPILNEDSLRE